MPAASRNDLDIARKYVTRAIETVLASTAAASSFDHHGSGNGSRCEVTVENPIVTSSSTAAGMPQSLRSVAWSPNGLGPSGLSCRALKLGSSAELSAPARVRQVSIRPELVAPAHPSGDESVGHSQLASPMGLHSHLGRHASLAHSASIGDLGGLGLHLEDLSRCTSLAVSRRQSVGFESGLVSVIDDVLCLGSHRDVCNIDHVRDFNIRAFLCVAREVTGPLPNWVSNADLQSGAVQFLHLPLADGVATTLSEHFADVFKFIDENAAAGRPVALFCQQGKSRSASFVLAYLMREHGWDVETALSHLQAIYPKAEPNWFFLNQLKALDHSSLPPRRPFSAKAPPLTIVSDVASPSEALATPEVSPDAFGQTATPDEPPLRTPSYLKARARNDTAFDAAWVREADDTDPAIGAGCPLMPDASGDMDS